MEMNKQNAVVMTEEDYNLLKPYANKRPDGEMSLANELGRAVIVKKDAFPPKCIKINSNVEILDVDTGKTMRFMLVMPEQADMKKQKVSVLSPIGAALIGFRETEQVVWKVPAGLKKIQITYVSNT
ncbi:GreA/GreB family elongation factor [Pedobacter sp. AW31-3R]|uniref:GreA/GreB family elongation factor n=1 Tax=Pedobacter sp. AW31-3R TaxID=3445781 RepID=UPI003FA06974